MRYRQRGHEVEAFQYLHRIGWPDHRGQWGHAGPPAWFQEYVTLGKARIRGTPGHQQVFIDVPGDRPPQVPKFGDWIVRTKDGAVYVCPEHTFAERYEPVWSLPALVADLASAVEHLLPPDPHAGAGGGHVCDAACEQAKALADLLHRARQGEADWSTSEEAPSPGPSWTFRVGPEVTPEALALIEQVAVSLGATVKRER